ncbi:related to conserved hypothetical Ustilaginaceae-specific protein [Ustilago trichophora]|uniref:Related to conserved hypothetical Ustilaginaceae-specific protein n=1 Tax=Ustilago trichophora TaxID=86804 RepID=A0A5C3E8S9_9BASI|nr:related to conserved hypothetical Ustilaginaceae-specific protein [Ustilago trichophora]
MAVIFRTTLFTLILFLPLTLAAPEPPLTRPEQRLYNHWNEEYRMQRYDPMLLGAGPLSYYSHMTSYNPRLEMEALEWAHTHSNGPYQYHRIRGALYVSTTIRGNQGPAQRWNLRQRGHQPKDVSVFWRIDHRGPKMLRFDLWPAGANTPQMISMHDAMASIPFRIS